jgi:sigma54-dependent transcription regulator
MSLRGIDAQIMLTRAIEYQRPAAAEQQRAALMSDFQNVEGRVRTQHKSERVAETAKSEQVLLHPDGDGGAAYYGAFDGGGARDEAEDSGPELTKPSDDGRVIDITV